MPSTRAQLPRSEAPFPSFTSTWRQASYPALDPTQPALSAEGKNVFITGGGSGIGAAIGRSFAAASAAHIGLLGRTESKLRETKESIERQYPSAHVTVYVGDVTSKGQLDRAFDDFGARAGQVNVFVNNAGYYEFEGNIKDANPDAWMKGIDVNLKGSLLATQAFLRHAATDATVVNVASFASFVFVMPGLSPYNVSKAAAVTFFASLQIEHPDMRIVSLQPGAVRTGMNRKAGGPDLDDPALPGDFSVWLASPEAWFTKGKYLFANWDVEEMKERAEEIAQPPVMEMWINGLEYVQLGTRGADVFGVMRDMLEAKAS